MRKQTAKPVAPAARPCNTVLDCSFVTCEIAGLPVTPNPDVGHVPAHTLRSHLICIVEPWMGHTLPSGIQWPSDGCESCYCNTFRFLSTLTAIIYQPCNGPVIPSACPILQCCLAVTLAAPHHFHRSLYLSSLCIVCQCRSLTPLSDLVRPMTMALLAFSAPCTRNTGRGRRISKDTSLSRGRRRGRVAGWSSQAGWRAAQGTHRQA